MAEIAEVDPVAGSGDKNTSLRRKSKPLRANELHPQESGIKKFSFARYLQKLQSISPITRRIRRSEDKDSNFAAVSVRLVIDQQEK